MMERLEDWIRANKIQLGEWARDGVEWLTGHYAWFFDGLSNGIGVPINAAVDLLGRIPPLPFALGAALLGLWLQRSLKVALFLLAGLLLILNLGLWQEFIETLVLVSAAAFVSLLFGVPIGIIAARRPWFYHALAPVLDMMQTIPTFVYLVPTLVLFGLGLVPGLIATVIFAIPAPIRLTYLGLSQVDKALIEAGEAFGCTRRQLLFRVKLPAAWPSLMAGVNQCIMLSLSMVVIAALVGAGGLGTPTVRALAQSNVALGVEAGLAIVIVAIGLDRVLRSRPRRTRRGVLSLLLAPLTRRAAPDMARTKPRPASRPAARPALPAVRFEEVDVVFGPRREEALAMLDRGAGRDEVMDRLGAVVAVHGASLFVNAGEILVLMGLSGSGKSSLLRCVNGLNRVARGSVWVEDEGAPIDVARCPPDVLRRLRRNRVSMVFQQFALMPWLTVAENVGFGLDLRGMPRLERERIVNEKIALVRLERFADKYPHELSGGMQQRVGLARAFATEADILLMDEPFSALDPLIRSHLQDELIELQQRLHKTIIFVSHDLDEALKIGSRIAIMEGGRVVQFGTPADIILNPVNDYVRDFLASMNPVAVLRAEVLMRPLAPAGAEWITLEGKEPVRVHLDPAGRPIEAFVANRAVTINPYTGEETSAQPLAGSLVAVPAALAMRDVVALRVASGLPLVVCDGEGRLIGMIDEMEIYHGLLREQRRRHAADRAALEEVLS
jgi:glycine betaine/proline transport system ATP-binding protein